MTPLNEHGIALSLANYVLFIAKQEQLEKLPIDFLEENITRLRVSRYHYLEKCKILVSAEVKLLKAQNFIGGRE